MELDLLSLLIEMFEKFGIVENKTLLRKSGLADKSLMVSIKLSVKFAIEFLAMAFLCLSVFSGKQWRDWITRPPAIADDGYISSARPSDIPYNNHIGKGKTGIRGRILNNT